MASFEYFLDESPSGKELAEHLLGPLLNINESASNVYFKTAVRLIDLCQQSSVTATRRQVLDILKDLPLEVGIAQEYKKILKRLHSDTSKSVTNK